ncbi:MAG: hypothetical protein ABI467_14870 [Kofleriaceae bacterium]
MGLFVVLGVLLAVVVVIVACFYVLTPKRSGSRHGWLAIVPLFILFGWVLETILVH